MKDTLSCGNCGVLMGYIDTDIQKREFCEFDDLLIAYCKCGACRVKEFEMQA